MKYLVYLKNLFFNFLNDSFEPFLNLPKNIYKEIIGYSIKKRPIFVYRLGQGEKKILFVSGIHGNEIGTVKLANHLINWLNQEKNLTKRYVFYIIPCLNIDGFSQAQEHRDYFRGGLIGRLNTNQVDLNRNFNVPSFKSEAIWNYGYNYQKSKTVSAGSAGNSESEIKALVEFIDQEKIEMIFSFHNAGKDVLASNQSSTFKLAENYARVSGYNLMKEDEWLALGQTGTFKEWCEQRQLIYLEIETANRYASDWEVNRKALFVFFKNNP